jgi:hypothetical protein
LEVWQRPENISAEELSSEEREKLFLGGTAMLLPRFFGIKLC